MLRTLRHRRITPLQADYTSLFHCFCAFLLCCDLLGRLLLRWLFLLVFDYGLLGLGLVFDFGGGFV